MKTVKVRKIYDGTVSLRDYVIRQAIKESESIKVIFEGKYMVLNPEDLMEKKRQRTARLFKSKLGDESYYLWDYPWKPEN